MINLGVDVIGTPGEHHNRLMLGTGEGNNPLAALLNLRFKGVVGSKGSIHSLVQLLFRNISIFPVEELVQLLHQHLFVQQAQIVEEEVRLCELAHVGMQHLGIIGHHGAIIAVFRALLANIIGHAGVKDMVNTLVQQPLDMTVHELSRVADGIAGDGVLPHAINIFIFNRTGHNLKAQMIEQPLPKGQQLVHIEAHGNAHHATLGRIEVRQSLEQLQLLTI